MSLDCVIYIFILVSVHACMQCKFIYNFLIIFLIYDVNLFSFRELITTLFNIRLNSIYENAERFPASWNIM